MFPFALFQSWTFSPGLILVTLLAGMLYTRGWLKLRQRHSTLRGLHDGWLLLSYWGGWIVLFVALNSPIDTLGSQLFAFHMIQHLLLVMIVPPLLWLANPFPVILWGLPGRGRKTVGAWFRADTPLRRILHTLTPPGWVWMASVTVYIGWHDPNAYNAALRIEWVHSLEHISFLLTAMLFWWHVMGTAPHIHAPLKTGLRLAYVASMIPINMGAGVAIAFSQRVIYTYYASVPRMWGLSVMQDQMLAGTIMWIIGSMMYLLAGLILAARLLKDEERKQPLPESRWAQEERLLAPGWGEQG